MLFRSPSLRLLSSSSTLIWWERCRDPLQNDIYLERGIINQLTILSSTYRSGSEMFIHHMQVMVKEIVCRDAFLIVCVHLSKYCSLIRRNFWGCSTPTDIGMVDNQHNTVLTKGFQLRHDSTLASGVEGCHSLVDWKERNELGMFCDVTLVATRSQWDSYSVQHLDIPLVRTTCAQVPLYSFDRHSARQTNPLSRLVDRSSAFEQFHHDCSL